MEELVNALKRLLDDLSTYLAILTVPAAALATVIIGIQMINADDEYESASIKKKGRKIVLGIALAGFGPKLVSWIWSYFSG